PRRRRSVRPRGGFGAGPGRPWWGHRRSGPTGAANAAWSAGVGRAAVHAPVRAAVRGGAPRPALRARPALPTGSPEALTSATMDPSRPSRLEVTPRRFRAVAIAALAVMVAVVVTGATVRLTGSGMG